MATRTAVGTRYEYNARTMRYRDTASGRFVRPSTVKRALQTVIRKSRERMRALADDLDNRKIRLADWQRQFAAEIKLVHVASAQVGRGGLAAMTPADYGRVGARLRFEYERLNLFARALANQEFTRGALLARVEMYCNAGQVSFEAAREEAAFVGGMEQERNVLGPRENHCESNPDGSGRPGCVNLTEQGWVALGTLPAVGSRKCLSNCGCSKQYRRRPRSRATSG